MPLPANDTPWPPPQWADIAADIRKADVWYSGDADALASFYASVPVEHRRSFWGRTRSGARVSTERRVHLPVAASIASASADLLFGDEVTLTVPDDEAATDRLAELAAAADVASTLLESAELASGLGGVFLRVVWDPSTADHPMLVAVDPDRAIPEFRWGQLVAVTLWSEVDRGNQGEVVRHLERYSPGLIEHGVYVGTDAHLGHRSSLRSYAATKELEAAKTDGEVLNLTSLLGQPYMAAGFVPNIRPNRARRLHPLGRWMGRADTAGLESVMSALDETWSSLLRDIDLGKRRIIVPDDFLDKRGRGRADTFDLDREVFSPLRMEPNEKTIEVVDFAIRAEDHLRPAAKLFGQIVASAGYSTRTLGDDESGAARRTATEVDSEDNVSERTTAKKRRYWTGAIESLSEVMLAVDRSVFRSGITAERPRLEWPEGTDNRLREVANTLNVLNTARAMSTESKVAMIHPDWPAAEVAAEVARIHAEDSVQVADPFEGVG